MYFPAKSYSRSRSIPVQHNLSEQRSPKYDIPVRALICQVHTVVIGIYTIEALGTRILVPQVHFTLQKENICNLQIAISLAFLTCNFRFKMCLQCYSTVQNGIYTILLHAKVSHTCSQTMHQSSIPRGHLSSSGFHGYLHFPGDQYCNLKRLNRTEWHPCG